jgi:hypothetical protein
MSSLVVFTNFDREFCDRGCCFWLFVTDFLLHDCLHMYSLDVDESTCYVSFIRVLAKFGFFYTFSVLS